MRSLANAARLVPLVMRRARDIRNRFDNDNERADTTAFSSCWPQSR